MKIQDLYELSFYGNLKKRAFVKSVASQEDDSYHNTLYLIDGQQPKALTYQGKEANYLWLDEYTILFSGNRTQQKDITILYALDVRGSEAYEYARLDKEGYRLVDLYQDGLILAREEYLVEKEPEDYEVFDELPFYFNAKGITNKKRTHYFYYHEGQLEPLFDPRFEVSQLRVEKDHLLVVGALFDKKSPWTAGVYRYDGQFTELFPSDQAQIYDAFTLKDQIYVVASFGKRYGINENPQFYRLDNKNLTLVSEWNDCIGNTVGTDCRPIGGNASFVSEDSYFFVSTIVDHTVLYQFTDEQIYTRLDWPGAIDAFDVSKDVITFIASSPNGLQELYRAVGSEVVQLSSFHDVKVSPVEEVSAVSSDGQPIYGWVIKPTDFDPNKTYPAILDIHGGPKTVYGSILYHEMQVWAEEGYFVFFCNIHGSDGRGNEYMDIRGRYGTIDYEDLMAFTDAVLEAYPQIDQTRLGVTGGSYGGFMTNWIIGHTNRFKAAASQRSISNWLSFAQTSDIGPRFAADQCGADIYRDHDKLWEQSPLKYANQVQTPTLFIHSDEDYRCPLSEGIQMLNALLDQGIESRLVVFHGENHELSRSGKPSHRVRRLTEITEWMNQHLK